MRPKFQKQSALKLAGRIIPHSGGCETPLDYFGFTPVVLIFSKGRMKGVLVFKTGRSIKTPAYAVLITFLNLFTKWVSGFVLL